MTLSNTILASTTTYGIVTDLAVEISHAIDDIWSSPPFLEDMFPNLGMLVVISPYSLELQLKHDTLHCLILEDVIAGSGAKLVALLSPLPSLREVYIASTCTDLLVLETLTTSAVELSAIEVFVIVGEYLALDILSHSTMPSLKFLALKTNGTAAETDEDIPDGYLSFFSRSRLARCTISMTGPYTTRCFLGPLIKDLSNDTLLHVDVESFDGSYDANAFDPGSAKEIFLLNLELLEEWTKLARCKSPV
jgi:hypothetical protein